VLLPATGPRHADTPDGPSELETPRVAEADALRDVNPLTTFDTWELDEQLRHVERILAAPAFDVLSAAPPQASRFDPAEAAPTPNRTLDIASSTPQPGGLKRDKPFAIFVSWTFLSCGLATFTCGGILTGWSIAAARNDLWNIGLPTVLTGSLGLLIGLVGQLDLVRHAHRVLACDLARVERKLAQVMRFHDHEMRANVQFHDREMPANRHDHEIQATSRFGGSSGLNSE
jgi:hypothetical protein